jgi:hypothetical protein
LVARRISTLEAELVFLEDKFAATRAGGGGADMAQLDLYGRLADRQRRLADLLGWRRTPLDVQSFRERLEAEAAAQAELISEPLP